MFASYQRPISQIIVGATRTVFPGETLAIGPVPEGRLCVGPCKELKALRDFRFDKVKRRYWRMCKACCKAEMDTRRNHV